MSTSYDGRPPDEVDRLPSGGDALELNNTDNHGTTRQASDNLQNEWLRALGIRQARRWSAVTSGKRPKGPKTSWKKANTSVSCAVRIIRSAFPAGRTVTSEQRWILDNARFLRGAFKEVQQALKSIQKLPCVRRANDQPEVLARAHLIATSYLEAVNFAFDEESFGEYLAGIQQVSPLEMKELWALKPLLLLVLLEQLGHACETTADGSGNRNGHGELSSPPPSRVIASLHEISQMEWKEFFEAHCVVDHILRRDPSGAYPRMDFESRQLYRDAVSELAQYSRLSEIEIARRAVIFARRAKERKWGTNQRATERRSNAGYYLLDAGAQRLKRSIGYQPSLKKKIKDAVLEWPEVYYVAGVELTTLVMIYLLLRHLGTLIPFLPGLLLLIPASQAAVGLMNHLTAWLLPPRRLPRLDFSDGIPAEFQTLVVVPTLLLNEKEVRHMVELLEVRYLANRDPNLHFALLTDSPDARSPSAQQEELAGLCSSLIEQLNRKYGAEHQGTFFHLYRRHVFNPQENAWMGWERKRGKLLDLNWLLLNGVDNFPIKVGNLSLLRRTRYVITLDSDTRLPRDTAHKLVGTIAHPLNRAVIDRRTNIVVEGYGILQPRVGISIESARKSRLARIYSGETGIDIYTRAVSDVYQDLFAEGSFTGKGIYEVETFQRVLGNRFPQNALLSHDLIEGVYARAGLVSDIEVIDDYPSHFSAYCRRLHRWTRGDWQILRWIFPRVPDFSGRLVANPITLLSRWKIFDNLRRSLIELNLFLLLLAGWFFFPGGPLYWTLVTLALLLMPTYVQLFFALMRMKGADNLKGFLKERANDFATGHLQVFVMLVFLPHMAFVMLDAIIRTITRLTITHRNLLEWETAAEAEMGTGKRTAVERYLDLTPLFAAVAAGSLAFLRPSALYAAGPVLALWLFAGKFTRWVNQPPHRRKNHLDVRDKTFLRHAALVTWRYFREFSNAGVNWLVPDRVQETPPAVVNTISPTNLGILLNARLAAYHLGYLTLAEFIDQTEATLQSVRKLARYRGHFLNWYDAKTLQPIAPQFVSTVDSGNLAACLWTLKRACLGITNEPIVAQQSWQGVRDHFGLVLHVLNLKAPPADVVQRIQELGRAVEGAGNAPTDWVPLLPRLRNEIHETLSALRGTDGRADAGNFAATDELAWWLSETLDRIEALQRTIRTLMPWLLPEYADLQLSAPQAQVTIASLPSQSAVLRAKLQEATSEGKEGAAEAIGSLRARLEICAQKAMEMAGRLGRIADEAEALLQAMDFRFLYNPKRKLLWIGYDVDNRKPAKSYYDLLGTEARTAVFIAIAKGDIRQEAWFHLGRARAIEQGEITIVSWSGTLFEYLMPLLWMRSYDGTMLDQNIYSAVLCQQKFAKKHGIPWGISEAAYNTKDADGIYQYRAFGLPGLAMDPNVATDVVVAPYAAFLGLLVNAPAAARNLRAMSEKGWFGRYGFYESADYTNPPMPEGADHALVRCWMAHHQGMSLLAACNVLADYPLQRWFHQEPRVKAAELLLHEKISRAAPEEAASASAPQLPPRARKKDSASLNALVEQPTAGKQPTRGDGKLPLDPFPGLSATGDEAPPPQV